MEVEAKEKGSAAEKLHLLYRKQSVEFKQGQGFGSVNFSPDISGWIIVGICFFSVMAVFGILCFGHYTHKEKASGSLIPDGGLVTVSSDRSGVVDRVYIKENDFVREGYPLVSIINNKSDSHLVDNLSTTSTYLDQNLFDVEAELSRINKRETEIVEGSAAHRVAFVQKEKLLSNQLKILVELLERQKKTVASMRELVEITAISSLELQVQLEKIASTSLQVEVLKRELVQLSDEQVLERQTVKKLLSDNKQQVALLKEQRLDVLKKIADNNVNRSSLVLAAHDGVVLSVDAKEGSFVNEGSGIVTVSQGSSDLIAELLVSDRALGFINIGNEVSIRYLAYPYQKFGKFTAKIKSIASLPSRDIAPSKNAIPGASYYKVKASIRNQFVVVGNEKIPLRAGYTFDADILTIRRTLLEWILEPFSGAQRLMFEK